MIQLYKKDNDNYEYNGDYTLSPISCTLEQTINDAWQVTIEISNEDESFYDITEEAVLAIPTPNSEKQLYRIYKTEKDDFSITAYAFPIFLDAANDTMLLDVRVVDQTGQQALDSICEGTKYSGYSNITDVASAYYIRKNLIEAIASDADNSFLKRWGGEIFYDNYTIKINRSIGINDFGRVAFGYNMVGVRVICDTSNMATRIIPLAYNGYMLEGAKPWVDSPDINHYSKIYIKTMQFEDVKLKQDCSENETGYDTLEELRAALISRVKKEYNNGIDKPTLTYEVDMIDLSQYEEYKDLAELEKIHLGDKVTCKNERLNINTVQEAVKLTYDCISRRVTSVTLSTVESNYLKDISSVINKTNKAVNSDGTVKGENIVGTIDLMQSKLRAIHRIASKQEERAILFEDIDPHSDTYGAMALGTTGFMIASQKDQNGEWVYKTFGTGEGFLADCIIAGVMYSQNYKQLQEGCKIDLNTGVIEANKLTYKGAQFDVYIQTKVDDAVAESGQHKVYETDEIPTLYNYPANEWFIPMYPSENHYPSEGNKWEYDYSTHVGSIVYTKDGTCYVFRCIDGEYVWSPRTDSETAFLLKSITELKVNDGKIEAEVKTVSDNLKDNYYTIEESKSQIEQTEKEIKSEVAKTYTPISNMEKYPTKTEMKSTISQTANGIISEVSAKYTTKGETQEVKTEIEQNSERIRSKVERGNVSSEISQEAGLITIKSNRLYLGSTNTIITSDGKITSKSVDITGGSINMHSASQEASLIELIYGNYTTWINPGDTWNYKDNEYSRASTFGIECGTRSYKDGAYQYSPKAYMMSNGNLRCEGTKNRIVDTDIYGKKLLYCYEMSMPMFGDIGEAKLDDTGVCVIYIDDIFSGAISDKVAYQIFLQEYGEGKCYVQQRCSTYFIVRGTPNISFGWEIKAVQKGYSSIRLENEDIEDYKDMCKDDDTLEYISQLINNELENIQEE